MAPSSIHEATVFEIQMRDIRTPLKRASLMDPYLSQLFCFHRLVPSCLSVSCASQIETTGDQSVVLGLVPLLILFIHYSLHPQLQLSLCYPESLGFE